MYKLPMFGFTFLAFAAVIVILSIGAWFVFKSGEKGETKLGGCAGCALGFALFLLGGLVSLAFLGVALVNTSSESIKRGPFKSFELQYEEPGEKGSDSADSSASNGHPDKPLERVPDSEKSEAGADKAKSDSPHLRLSITMRADGDTGKVMEWLRENTDVDWVISTTRKTTDQGELEVIVISLPLPREDMDELKRNLERDAPGMKLPKGIKIEVKDPDK